MDRLIMFIATGAYSGYLPKAPGTWGSIIGVGLWAGMYRLGLLPYVGVVALLFIIGTACAGSAEKILNQGDPGIVVIDEIVGQLIALTAAPLNPAAALLGFTLFRFFDIIKPWPIQWLDRRVTGGVGIMVDDLVAGLFSNAVLWGVLTLLVESV